MRRADRVAAARALRHLIHAHRLVGSALTVPQALRAQTAASLGRIRVALLRMPVADRSEEHTSELQSQSNLVCRLLLEKKKQNTVTHIHDTSGSRSIKSALIRCF